MPPEPPGTHHDAWQHPGGKLRERGASALSESELLAVLIGSGVRGRNALAIAEEVLAHYGSLQKLLAPSPVGLGPEK